MEISGRFTWGTCDTFCGSQTSGTFRSPGLDGPGELLGSLDVGELQGSPDLGYLGDLLGSLGPGGPGRPGGSFTWGTPGSLDLGGPFRVPQTWGNFWALPTLGTLVTFWGPQNQGDLWEPRTFYLGNPRTFLPVRPFVVPIPGGILGHQRLWDLLGSPKGPQNFLDLSLKVRTKTYTESGGYGF